MEITVDKLLKTGKATKIKEKAYFSTSQYVIPFLERMSNITDDFRVQVKLPDQISYTKDGEIKEDDLVYNRVWIQAVLPTELSIENHKQVIGLVYGLDVRKPVAKIYSGGLNMACTNLCIFSPDYLDVQEIQPETPINYKSVNFLIEKTLDVAAQLKRLKEIEVPYNERTINENLGKWVRKAMATTYNNGYGKIKIAADLPIDAYKLLYEDKESPYYVQYGYSCSMFDVYNAMTQIITNDTRDIMNKAEKTMLIKYILES